MSKIENKNLEAELNGNEEEEVDDNTPVDPEIEKKMRNLKIDDSAFGGEGDESKSKKRKTKQPKEKSNKKEQDFLEFAKKNEIEVKIKYEKSPEKKDLKLNENTKNNNQKPFNNNKKDFNNQKGNYNNKYYNNKKNYNKNNNKGGFQPKNFNNKFDPMNAYNNNPYMMYPMNNQGVMRPDMMYYGQMPMNHQLPNFPVPNQHQQIAEEQHPSIGGKGVKESLEYYLSLDNLNKDLFLRKKIDINGYIEVDDILKFNNMVKNNATHDTIKDVLKESKVVEEKISGGKTYLRNKLWEEIKHNLISIEDLETKKSHKKGNYNYNYVTMQNNYFMPMMPYDPSMFGGAPMNHMMNPMNHNMMGGMNHFNQVDN